MKKSSEKKKTRIVMERKDFNQMVQTMKHVAESEEIYTRIEIKCEDQDILIQVL